MNEIIITEKELTDIVKKQTKNKVEKDIQKTINSISDILLNVSSPYVSSKLEKIKKVAIEAIKKEEKNLYLDLKNKDKVEFEIKQYIENLLDRIKYNISKKERFTISGINVSSSSIKTYYDPSRNSLYITINDYGKTLVDFSIYIKEETDLEAKNLRIRMDKKIEKGLQNIIENNKNYIVEQLKKSDIDRIIKLSIHLSNLMFKNNKSFHHPYMVDFFEKHDFDNAEELLNELLKIKDTALIMHDLDLVI